MVECHDYPTVDVADPDATLTVRTSPLGPRQDVPRARWRFTSPTRFTVDGGFQPFHYYELVYRSATAPVVGAGLLALRDLGSHLKARHDQVLATGSSQCGRLLRHFLFEGLNVDESGRQVFDGVFAEIASARRGEFNQRYGRPGLLHPLTPAYGPPHDTSSLLARQRALGGTPKIMFTNSSWEYWRGDGALLHQDAHTGEDLPEDPDARVHLLAGTDHL
ncbi:alpha/beta hydrolase domain-containing protein, partial [Frankia sp. EI5c]|uniref:alpha/beta hydrolase domain-containing protein n=1 Tax=Frankia sp. EI5c TaxID=683316 RepID=UPI0037BEA032